MGAYERGYFQDQEGTGAEGKRDRSREPKPRRPRSGGRKLPLVGTTGQAGRGQGRQDSVNSSQERVAVIRKKINRLRVEGLVKKDESEDSLRHLFLLFPTQCPIMIFFQKVN